MNGRSWRQLSAGGEITLPKLRGESQNQVKYERYYFSGIDSSRQASSLAKETIPSGSRAPRLRRTSESVRGFQYYGRNTYEQAL